MPGNEGLTFFAALSFVLILMFTRTFLHTESLPRLDRWVKALLGLCATLSLSALVVPAGLGYKLIMPLVFLFPSLSMVVGIVTLRAGRREARYFVLGQAASWIGLLGFGLMIVGVLPYSAVLFESPDLGIVVDSLLLALALAERIRFLQSEKVRAEELLRIDLEERKAELERLVAQRTAELDAAREQAELLARIDPLTGTITAGASTNSRRL